MLHGVSVKVRVDILRIREQQNGEKKIPNGLEITVVRLWCYLVFRPQIAAPVDMEWTHKNLSTVGFHSTAKRQWRQNALPRSLSLSLSFLVPFSLLFRKFASFLSTIFNWRVEKKKKQNPIECGLLSFRKLFITVPPLSLAWFAMLLLLLLLLLLLFSFLNFIHSIFICFSFHFFRL